MSPLTPRGSLSSRSHVVMVLWFERLDGIGRRENTSILISGALASVRKLATNPYHPELRESYIGFFDPYPGGPVVLIPAIRK
jgi:hypothetical protein